MAQFKIMPHNLEAEQAILGCILIDVQLQAEIMSTLEEVDFYSDAHQNIFKSMLSVYQKNVPVDFVTLTNELEKKGSLEKVGGIEYITFLTNTKVIELTKTPLLACTGVRAISKTDGLLELKARAGVVVATGGFHANREMICKYMGGGVAWMPLRGSAYMMGENIELTRPFLPYYTNLDQFHGGPIHGPTQANPSTMVNYGIIVNKEGARILDEVMTYVAVAKKLPSITPDNWAFIVIDQQVVDIPTVKTRIDRYKKAKAPIHSGNTIAELAADMGVNAKVLEKTVADYNAAVKAGKAADLTPPNTLEKPRLLEKGPFLAFPFQGGMTATFGGPLINGDGQVLNAEKQPIPGLYAIGNAIGGLFYDDYIVGSQLTAAVIWGRLAAQHAVGTLKKA